MPEEEDIMTAPLVSAIVPTFDRAWCIGRAIESVLAQTYRSLEFLVVDDASTDDTASVLKDVEEKRRRQGGDRVISLEVLRRDARGGVSAARNTGIRRARGALIAFLDSDDEWLPEKTARQVALHLRNPGLMLSQTGERWMRRGAFVNPPKRLEKTAGDLFERSLAFCAVSPSAVMLRREIFDDVGLFDESFPACEDYEMWLRVTCRHEVGLVPQPLVVKHGGHEDQLSSTVEALDRHRIRAIVKALRSNLLSSDQHALALAALQMKCRIYGQGCRKRGREDEAREVLSLPERLREGVAGPRRRRDRGRDVWS